jgi:hypothetical protein
MYLFDIKIIKSKTILKHELFYTFVKFILIDSYRRIPYPKPNRDLCSRSCPNQLTGQLRVLIYWFFLGR